MDLAGNVAREPPVTVDDLGNRRAPKDERRRRIASIRLGDPSQWIKEGLQAGDPKALYEWFDGGHGKETFLTTTEGSIAQKDSLGKKICCSHDRGATRECRITAPSLPRRWHSPICLP